MPGTLQLDYHQQPGTSPSAKTEEALEAGRVMAIPESKCPKCQTQLADPKNCISLLPIWDMPREKSRLAFKPLSFGGIYGGKKKISIFWNISEWQL